MNHLLIETCTEQALVAITRDNEIAFQHNLPFGLQNGHLLAPAIKTGLDFLKLSPHDLYSIGIGIGPGSFTGMRVGAMTAKAFAYAVKKPLISICTLFCLVPQHDGLFVALLDAKMGGIYCLAGRQYEGKIVYDSEPEVGQIEQFQDILEKAEIIVTPHVQTLQAKFDKFFPLSRWAWQQASIDMSRMAELTHAKFGKGEFSPNYNIDLLYLRKYP